MIKMLMQLLISCKKLRKPLESRSINQFLSISKLKMDNGLPTKIGLMKFKKKIRMEFLHSSYCTSTMMKKGINIFTKNSKVI